ncbi:hypothetical protein [uncultured Alistipes sp.]|uniref:hypothetical protein n=1 Tax=uncultured Alistipes sp. TaxID=538949 RepID=UPI0025F4EFB5|nr:hypothetical protein [uncultured Alistipes sp.]
MKKMWLITTLTVLALVGGSNANAQSLPRKVSDLELVDLNGNPVTLPMWGEKNLMIFYVDPDHHKQNEAFTQEMEANHRTAGDNLYGFGVINLKDSWYPIPDSTVRNMARKRTEKNGATVITDPDRLMSEAWGLGDCNNQFVLMIVTKEGELVYVHKGEYTEKDKEEFYRFVEAYK